MESTRELKPFDKLSIGGMVRYIVGSNSSHLIYLRNPRTGDVEGVLKVKLLASIDDGFTTVERMLRNEKES